MSSSVTMESCGTLWCRGEEKVVPLSSIGPSLPNIPKPAFSFSRKSWFWSWSFDLMLWFLDFWLALFFEEWFWDKTTKGIYGDIFIWCSGWLVIPYGFEFPSFASPSLNFIISSNNFKSRSPDGVAVVLLYWTFVVLNFLGVVSRLFWLS